MSARRALVSQATRTLADAGVASPEADATTLLAHVLGTTRAGLVPVIALFALGLLLLGWVNKNGDRAA